MDMYKFLITVVNSTLKKLGFEKNGTLYYIRKDKNWGIISFQKSQSFTKENIRFTINIGISSSALRIYVDDSNSVEKPEVTACHWNCRIGSLMPDTPDHWWELNQSPEDEDVIFDVIKMLKSLVVPAVLERITDEGLIKEWTTGSYAGTSLFNKYVYLTTLLKLSRSENLVFYSNEFLKIASKKPFDMDAKYHVQNLEKIP